MDDEMEMVTPDPDPEPTPEETAAAEETAALTAAQEGAMAAYMAAMAAVAGGVDPVAMYNAQMYADMAKTASDAAAMAETSAMAGEYQMAAETARDMAMEAAGARSLGITKLANAAANQSAINSAALIGVPAPPPLSNAGRVGAAIRAAAAAAATATTIAAPAVDTNGDGNTDTLVSTSQGGMVSAAARHTGSAPRFTVAPTVGGAGYGLSRGEIPTALMMSGEKPGGGWPGAELVRRVGATPGPATKENAVIYTDINPAAQTYGAAAALPAADLDRAIITGDIPGDGSNFAAMYNTNPTDNNPVASGRFLCPGTVTTGCSISVDASGVLRSITGYQWQAVVPGTTTRGDSDYMAWGFWLLVPDAVPVAGTPSAATVAAFATGNAVFSVPAALTGTATYNGVANGLYSAGGMVEYFKADASLTANFGGRTAIDSTPLTVGSDSFLLGAVSGAVTNIKAGGMDVDGSLTLGRAPLIAGNPTALGGNPTIGGAASAFTGSTEGALGSRALTGVWTGRFYGPQRAAGVAVRNEFPTTAAGTFGATTGVGPAVSILGSFGTWKSE